MEIEMKTTTITVPLVGMHFHPPAKQVLECLAFGTAVKLAPQPDNPYDSNAIRVLVRSDAIPVGQRAALADALAGTGFDLESVLRDGVVEENVDGRLVDSDGRFVPEIFLGFIARTRSDGRNPVPIGNVQILRAIADAGAGTANWTVLATLKFDVDGKPWINVVVGEESK
jgi:HIRAN domain